VCGDRSIAAKLGIATPGPLRKLVCRAAAIDPSRNDF
jgi:hypothetical protein